MNTHYAILGSGRLAQHMCRYLSLLGQPWTAWARDRNSPLNTFNHGDPGQRLRKAIAPASHVLLLVSDDAILPLVRQYPSLHNKTLIHCAGALSLPGIAGAHPLMTFADQPYSLAQYQVIPFLVESGYRFKDLFPALPNPSHTVSVEQKPLYHALCVMAGNFPQMLWRAASERFEGELDVPGEVLMPYLQQVVQNFQANPQAAMTGPLVRNDQQTIQRNIQALQGDALQPVYEAFLDLHQSEKKVQSDVREKAS